MGLRQSTSFAAASLVFAGCFAPDEGVDLETDGVAEGSTAGGGTDTAPATTDQPTGGMTTANPTSGTTMGNPTTANPTTDETTSWDPSDPTTTGGEEDPFCGDGNVDAGEECDDGLENNGLDQSCLPDCNLNVCGDSNIGPDEFCDDGADDNVLEVGACAPDCSTVIEEKVIRLGSGLDNGGNFQPNPVAYADAQCPAGFRALFAVPGVRQATDGAPLVADDPIDWPIRPYTAYVRIDGDPLWTTDDVPLLGVRDGASLPLLSQPRETCVGNFCPFLTTAVVTGLNADWTNVSQTCDGWSSASETQSMSVGNVESVAAFLRDAAGGTACSIGAEGVSVFGGTPHVLRRTNSRPDPEELKKGPVNSTEPFSRIVFLR